MDSTIIVAIVGAIATILSAIISNRETLAIEKKRREKGLIELPIARKEALQGKWKGCGIQRERRKGDRIERDKPFEQELEIEVQKKIILGSGKYIFKDPEGDEVANIIGEGKFRHERFFEFEFRNTDPSVIQFGYFMFVMSANGTELNGELIGFGKTSQTIVSATLKLTKVS